MLSSSILKPKKQIMKAGINSIKIGANKIIAIAILIICSHTVNAQLTIILDSVPRYYTPLFDSVYIGGSFNNWAIGSASYALLPNANGKPQITINDTGTIQFKFAHGGWASVEVNSSGGYVPNRTYTFTGNADTIHITIPNWADSYTASTHTVTNTVYVVQDNMWMPQLARYRRVWIYLPNDYYTSNNYYRTVYMMDGQNVFDAATSFAGEWYVDDSLKVAQLAGDSGAIVVAIDNGGQYRLDEYCPFINTQYGGGQGDRFTDFLVNTLKPVIDANFRTYTDREHTAIAGSSVGAYIALYAGIKHQAVFSKVGIFSPAYWFQDSIYTFVKNSTAQFPLRFYQVCSVNEGGSVVYNMNRMRDTLIASGFSSNDIYNISRSYGSHSETFWRKEFIPAYSWLFSNSIGNYFIEYMHSDKLSVYPNPADTFISIVHHLKKEEIKSIRIFNVEGKEQFAADNNITLQDYKATLSMNLTTGVYVVWIVDNDDKLFTKKFVVRR